MGIWEELGISAGTSIILLIVFYFIIKWAVKNGVKDAYEDIIAQRNTSGVENDRVIKEFEKD